MSSLPNEISFDITNFLPNDDITDLMLMSRKFYAHVTPRLKKINEDRETLRQSIKDHLSSPEHEDNDEWISQLNLKRFEPIGSVAKRRMKELFANNQEIEDCFHKFDEEDELDVGTFDLIKKGMSLEGFDDVTFFVIFYALIFSPEFCQEYNVCLSLK